MKLLDGWVNGVQIRGMYCLSNNSDWTSGAHLKLFWREVQKRNDPRLESHPMTAVPGWQARVVPYMLHSDAVPIIAGNRANSQSYDITSIQFMAARGSSKHIKHYVKGVVESIKSKVRGVHTDAHLDTVLRWSVEALLRGRWPEKMWDGTDWPRGSPHAVNPAS